MILNPNKPIRIAYIAALNGFVPVFAKNVPRNITVPDQFILITTQTKTRVNSSKPTIYSGLSDNFGWQVNTVLDLNSFSPAGYANPGRNDDLEELVVQAIENILVPAWTVKSRVFVQSLDLDIATATNYIERRVITYSHWMEQL
jgi:hypothetical protein